MATLSTVAPRFDVDNGDREVADAVVCWVLGQCFPERARESVRPLGISGNAEMRVIDQPEDGTVWSSDRRCHDAAANVTQRSVLGCSGSLAAATEAVTSATPQYTRAPSTGLALGKSPSS